METKDGKSYLIFIDTNIFLDFYRIRKSDISLKYLQEIEKHKNIIITSSQIEMEYKKNRQLAILESINEVKKINSVSLNVPPIVSNIKAVDIIKKTKKEIQKQQNKIKDKIEKILKNPSYNDVVFKSLQKLFNNKSVINLNRDSKDRFQIRELAKKRFSLGYPPKKIKDNSIGDSVNWEWIISCANKTQKSIIIVTRDQDFGCLYNGELILNDWLKQEFKQRVGNKQEVFLTNKLSKAFQIVKIPITEEMINEEKNIIGSLSNINLGQFDTSLFGDFSKVSLSPWNSMSKITIDPDLAKQLQQLKSLKNNK